MRSKNGTGGQGPSFIEQARRAQIIDATLHTVAEHGFANASLAKIAKRAGISKSVILYHFANKEEVLQSALEDFFAATEAHMRPRISAETTASGRLATWITSQISFFTENRIGFMAMAEIVGGLRNPDGSHMYANIDDEELVFIADILRDGQASGEFRDFDVEQYAALINRIVNGILIDWHENSVIDPTSHATVAAEFVYQATRRHP